MDIPQPLPRRRRLTLLTATGLIVLVAIVDWRVNAEVPVGILYLLPMVMASRALSRAQVAIFGLLCALLAEIFDGLDWSLRTGIPRDMLYVAAFCGAGLFAHEVGVRRRLAAAHIAELEQEYRARRDAEEQLQILVDSSPVAILTVDANSAVLLANDAAHRLFGVAPGALPGQPVQVYLPTLANIPDLRSGQQSFRTVMQCKGRRGDDDIFLADVWFSTYLTSVGPRLAAMVVDASDELRDREEAGLHQLLTGSRILISAVTHEVRNVCGAIALMYENLSRSGALARNADFEALGTLVLALERIAALELRQPGDQGAPIDLPSFLEELRIVIGSSFREKDIDIVWEIPQALPKVWADPQSLMQVFLNLMKNSERALIDRANAKVRIAAMAHEQHVLVTVADNGEGIPEPNALFQPFQQNAKATGLGLYLSRALMRSFGGDLRFQPGQGGAVFVVEISTIVTSSDPDHEKKNQTIVA